MHRAIAVLLLAFAPLGAAADTLPGSRAAEAILLGAQRQSQRTGVTLLQSGQGHAAAVGQSGTGNQGLIVQRGRGHSTFLAQTGTGNLATVIQLGRGASSVVVQMGSETEATVQIGQSGQRN